MHILQRYGKMEEHYMEKRIQEATFDVEVQYCDPDDCYHDCKLNVPNYCNEVVTLYWQKYQENSTSVPVGFPTGTLLYLYIFSWCNNLVRFCKYTNPIRKGETV